MAPMYARAGRAARAGRRQLMSLLCGGRVPVRWWPAQDSGEFELFSWFELVAGLLLGIAGGLLLLYKPNHLHVGRTPPDTVNLAFLSVCTLLSGLEACLVYLERKYGKQGYLLWLKSLCSYSFVLGIPQGL